MSQRILVIEDEDLKRLTIEDFLRQEGYEARGVADGVEGLEALKREYWDAAVVDMKLPGLDGMTILEKARRVRPDTAFIMMTAFGSVPGAVEAMKKGAHDYLTKPFANDELVLRLKRLLEHRSRDRQNAALKDAVDSEYAFHRMVATSRAMRRMLDQILTVADSDATVLIVGETGTGKELVAETIHYSSRRRNGPLVKVSCVALRETLIESELFGHERGAFSGAIRTRPGRFELAAGGTIFLDDIDDAPAAIQPKLLRVLENREFERVGGEETFAADVRVVAATKKDLSRLVKEGRFREDLYYRLNTVVLRLPPLRERKDEIAPLVGHFAAKHGRTRTNTDGRARGETGRRTFNDETLELLKRYSWPGNIRELEHVVEATLVLSKDSTVKPNHLPRDFLEKVALEMPSAPSSLKEELAGVERATLERTLKHFDGNISKAAKHLGVARSTLRDRLKKLSGRP
jgi:DNA-binding NtrC family response regulator